jgi:hypothetical protein
VPVPHSRVKSVHRQAVRANMGTDFGIARNHPAMLPFVHDQSRFFAIALDVAKRA